MKRSVSKNSQARFSSVDAYARYAMPISCESVKSHFHSFFALSPSPPSHKWAGDIFFSRQRLGFMELVSKIYLQGSNCAGSNWVVVL